MDVDDNETIIRAVMYRRHHGEVKLSRGDTSGKGIPPERDHLGSTKWPKGKVIGVC